jgi:hypothetical protein
MNDFELKQLLLETCPVLPGQEARAWASLQRRLSGGKSVSQNWFHVPVWRTLAYGALGLLLAAAIFDLGYTMRPEHRALAFADSESPGIYATSFYSNSAQAQVVWLNGMEPASDKPTYLDPTTVVSTRPAGKVSASRPPDSL